jgi:radical SAM superfamily enzyme YgiQ (UPF0313 family)
MKRLLLVNANTEKFPYPIPPLGICLIASYLQDRYQVKVFDGMFSEGKGLKEFISGFAPDYIGLSIRNVDEVVPERTKFFVKEVLRDFIVPIKQASQAPLILGGSGYSLFPAEILALAGADFGIAGEGEEALLELLACLDEGRDPAGIPGLYIPGSRLKGITRPNSFYSRNPWSRLNKWIDFAPYRQRGVYSIQTKRGCALKCLYCSYPLLEGKNYRRRDPADIAEEIAAARGELGEGITFEFVDSTFNDPPGHAEDICREIIKRNLRVRLRTMGVNPRHTGRELFELMIRAGFAQIDVTPDSASEAMIRNLRKGFTLADIQRTAKLLKEYDLPSMWFFLFGGPGETRQTYEETISFISGYINPDDLVYLSGGLRIYPGTPVHRQALDEGLVSATDDLLTPSVFYFSQGSPREELSQWIEETCKTHLNCLSGAESNPPQEMLKAALDLRNSNGLTEPMFRTLLRIRREWKKLGKL